MTDKTRITWADALARLAVIDKPGVKVYGVPRGGMIAAGFLRNAENVCEPDQADLILDDVVDSGRTRDRFKGLFPDKPFATLYDKTNGDSGLGWIVLPWESDLGEEAPRDAVVRLIQYIGEDPNRQGLMDTPDRVVRAFREMTQGYHEDPAAILSRTFDDAHDELIVCRGMRFASLCEHHLMPFTGTAAIGYLPDKTVVGLSKLPRLVQCFARRLQIQERMTRQIAEAIVEHLAPQGVGVVIRAKHNCMACRGAVQPDAEMITSAMLGAMRDKPHLKAELMGVL